MTEKLVEKLWVDLVDTGGGFHGVIMDKSMEISWIYGSLFKRENYE